MAKTKAMIDFLNFDICENNTDYLQPIELCFAKDPIEPALEQPKIYHIQIPRFMEQAPDFNNPLDCTLYTMMQSHQQHKTMWEVMQMSTQLQELANEYVGFYEFCERHGKSAADPGVRRQYQLWTLELMRRQDEKETAVEAETKKYKAEIAEKDAEIAGKEAEISEKDAKIADKEAEIAEKDTEIASKEAEIVELRRLLSENRGQN